MELKLHAMSVLPENDSNSSWFCTQHAHIQTHTHKWAQLRTPYLISARMNPENSASSITRNLPSDFLPHSGGVCLIGYVTTQKSYFLEKIHPRTIQISYGCICKRQDFGGNKKKNSNSFYLWRARRQPHPSKTFLLPHFICLYFT